ncbi:MAG: hypothetical protein AMDU1_APLC00099G0010 [Thermoplasmatales archaeon A-plasma]|nr:MAG: hypothetical protein AMDU1_APLC00099G0010 [Thermoplasmatales archaeon A-plasma]
MLKTDIRTSNSSCFSDTLTKIYFQLRISAPEGEGTGSGSALAVIVDRSGSMHGEKLDDAKDAAKMVLDVLGESNELALYSFANRVERIIPMAPVNDVDRIAKEIDRIRASGGTSLYRALETVYEDARKFSSEGGSVTAIILTDGQPSDVTDVDRYEKLAANASEIGMKIVSIGIGDYDETILKRISDITNGDFVNATDRNLVSDTFRKHAMEAATSGGSSVVLRLVPREAGSISVFDQSFTADDGIVTVNLGSVGSTPVNVTGSVDIKGGPEGSITALQAVLSYRDNDGTQKEEKYPVNLNRTRNSEKVVSGINRDLVNEARLKMQMNQVEYLISQGDFDTATRISKQAMEAANATRKIEFIDATRKLDRVLSSGSGSVDKKEAYNQTTKIKRN